MRQCRLYSLEVAAALVAVAGSLVAAGLADVEVSLVVADLVAAVDLIADLTVALAVAASIAALDLAASVMVVSDMAVLTALDTAASGMVALGMADMVTALTAHLVTASSLRSLSTKQNTLKPLSRNSCEARLLGGLLSVLQAAFLKTIPAKEYHAAPDKGEA